METILIWASNATSLRGALICQKILKNKFEIRIVTYENLIYLTEPAANLIIFKSFTTKNKKIDNEEDHSKEKGSSFRLSHKKAFKLFAKKIIECYQCLRILLKYRPKVNLIYGEFQAYTFETSIIKISRLFKIPTVITPFAYYSRPHQLALSRSDSQIYKSIQKSNYTYEYNGAHLSFYPPHALWVLKILGMLKGNPWITGTGRADFFLVDKAEDYTYFSEFVPKSKLLLINNIFHQYLGAKQFPSKEIDILFVMPQFVEHSIVDEEAFQVKMNPLLKSLNELNRSIAVSLHPKMDRAYYLGYFSEYSNFKIISEPLIEVISKAKNILSSYSSTLSWGEVVGVNVILFDFWNLNLGMEVGLANVFKTKTIAETISFLDRPFINRSRSDRKIDSLAETIRKIMEHSS